MQETNAAVCGDQDAQMRWHDIMKPAASMLKFRLLWEPGVTRYLDGAVHLQPYCPPHR